MTTAIGAPPARGARTLVAGIDSSTQSCKVTVREITTGVVVRSGSAPHPSTTLVDPEEWWRAMLLAIHRAGDLDDVSAISIGGQQHTPVFLDGRGGAVGASPLWNDVGSHRHMQDLNEELGRETWIERTGLPLSLSDTAAKLRWLRDCRPDDAARTTAVALVHDWLTWRLRGLGPHVPRALDHLVTDRSEASGTGYWSGADEDYCPDLLEHAFGRPLEVPRVLGPWDRAGTTASGIPGVAAGVPLGVGSGDNAAAALALGLQEADAVLSLGTSGVVYTRAAHAVCDLDGYVCSYADATGQHLPLVATMNAARNFDAAVDVLGCDYVELSRLALLAPAGAQGLTFMPYLEGERTPDLPDARASLTGASLANFTRANTARALLEGTLASQVEMLSALKACGVPVGRLRVIGGAARIEAVGAILTEMVDVPVDVPHHDEYVAMGAALQAAVALDGELRHWPVPATVLPPQPLQPAILEQHQAARAMLH